MKKVLLMAIAFCVAFEANAQDVPYSKYLSFNKQEFKGSRFKYDDETNTWSLNKTNSLNVTLNILCIIADAEEEIRPATNDYSIVVQMGRDEHAA